MFCIRIPHLIYDKFILRQPKLTNITQSKRLTHHNNKFLNFVQIGRYKHELEKITYIIALDASRDKQLTAFEIGGRLRVY